MGQVLKVVLFTAIFMFLFIPGTMAQPGPPPVSTPLDPVSLVVLIGGGAIAYKKMKADKKAKGKENDGENAE
jgi:hypothetical protein